MRGVRVEALLCERWLRVAGGIVAAASDMERVAGGEKIPVSSSDAYDSLMRVSSILQRVWLLYEKVVPGACHVAC